MIQTLNQRSYTVMETEVSRSSCSTRLFSSASRTPLALCVFLLAAALQDIADGQQQTYTSAPIHICPTGLRDQTTGNCVGVDTVNPPWASFTPSVPHSTSTPRAG